MEGQDKFHFMESMVKSVEIQKVLIILDKKYTDRAENRVGGVGTETQIISPKIYEDVSQEKFIPIVAETDENGNAYMPTFLQSRIYINLSEINNFEENYEKLLRNIYKRPAYNKPKLGKAPSYIFDNSSNIFKCSNIVRSFDTQILKLPNRINFIIRQFLDEFFNDLKSHTLSEIESTNEGKTIHDNIILYTPLRNEYIIFLDKIFKSEIEFDIDIFISFFEKLPSLKFSQEDPQFGKSSDVFSNYKFFIHEIFLYTIAIGLKNNKYKFIEEIFYSSYFFQDIHNYKNEPRRFNALYNYVEVFDEFYREIYSKNFLSPMADLIIKRVHESINKEDLVNADLLCHYIANLEELTWFPITYVYKNENWKYDLFNRLSSQRHFDKVKILFNVKTIKDLQDKLYTIKVNDNDFSKVKYSTSFDSVVPIYKLIDSEKIGTLR